MGCQGGNTITGRATYNPKLHRLSCGVQVRHSALFYNQDRSSVGIPLVSVCLSIRPSISNRGGLLSLSRAAPSPHPDCCNYPGPNQRGTTANDYNNSALLWGHPTKAPRTAHSTPPPTPPTSFRNPSVWDLRRVEGPGAEREGHVCVCVPCSHHTRWGDGFSPQRQRAAALPFRLGQVLELNASDHHNCFAPILDRASPSVPCHTSHNTEVCCPPYSMMMISRLSQQNQQVSALVLSRVSLSLSLCCTLCSLSHSPQCANLRGTSGHAHSPQCPAWSGQGVKVPRSIVSQTRDTKVRCVEAQGLVSLSLSLIVDGAQHN